MLSKELKFLFNLIDHALWNKPLQAEISDEAELIRLLEFHSIRLLAYSGLNGTDQLPVVRQFCHDFSRNQALLSLQQQVELARVSEILLEKNIDCLPMKGVLFAKSIYGNKQLREFSDIDILVRREDAAKTLEVLFKDGYLRNNQAMGLLKPSFFTPTEIISDPVFYEFPLFKKGIHIDFHWDMAYDFLPFDVDVDAFFRNSEMDRDGVRKPSLPYLFLGLLIHHGGKECWLKIKNLVDLSAFLKQYPHADWEEIFKLVEAAKLLNSLKNGLWLLQENSITKLPPACSQLIKNHEVKGLERIYKFWHKRMHWGNPKARLPFERILINQQDKGFRKRDYFQAFYKAYSHPASANEERIFNFPERFRFLNFTSKFLTYLLRKLRT